MAGKKLGLKQRAVMITLMSEGRPLSNTEMKEAHGLVLDGEDRRQLNKLGYVVSTQTKGNAPYVHELTEPGWRWCREELTAGRPRSSREESLGKALYAVLGGIARYLDHIEKIAVGTAVAGGPPRRSQRAELPHWAPALGSGVEPRVGERMLQAGGW